MRVAAGQAHHVAHLKGHDAAAGDSSGDSVSNMRWLNAFSTAIWPAFKGALAKTIQGTLQDILNNALRNKFPHARKLRFSQGLDFGDNGLLFTKVSADHSAFSKEAWVDLSFSYLARNSDLRATIKVTATGNTVPVVIENLDVKATVRVKLGRLVPVWPTFEAISISFIGEPEIKFDVGNLPVLSNKLGSFLTGVVQQHVLKNLQHPLQRVVHRAMPNAAALDRFVGNLAVQGVSRLLFSPLIVPNPGACGRCFV